MTTPLDQELATYEREKKRLLDEGFAGKYVLIKGDEVVGAYDTQLAAIDAGWEKYGKKTPILVKEIVEIEPPPVYVPHVAFG